MINYMAILFCILRMQGWFHTGKYNHNKRRSFSIVLLAYTSCFMQYYKFLINICFFSIHFLLLPGWQLWHMFLLQGPLKGFMEDLGRLQKKFYAKDERLCCPIRTYLVTARSAASSGARVLKTLRRWGLEIDEALFLAGAPKGPILAKIRPHLFFDDHMFHIEGAQKYGTTTTHVPYGISQKWTIRAGEEK